MRIPFADWELRPELRQALEELKFETATEVQEAAFRPVLAGQDIMVQSRTGSGKTLAFALPVLQRLDADETDVRVVVILPTRELCMQVAQSVRKLSANLGVRVAALYGGGVFAEQLRSLKSGASIVCGTPGRLCEHIERRTLKLERCDTLILDEADEMLKMGFADELQRIVAQLPPQRQTLLFSATLADAVQALARQSMREPLMLSVNEALSMPQEITHVCFETHPEEKTQALINLLHADLPERALVFCHTRLETEQLTHRLRDEGFRVALLNGDLPQVLRTRTLQQFRQGLVSVLVATDVAARGIDVEGITHVFNMAVPRTAETYVHRVGRTGRAGAAGQASTFVSPRDSRRFRHMLREAGVAVEIQPLPQAEALRDKLRARYLHALGEAKPTAPSQQLASELLKHLRAEDVVALLLERDPAARALLQAGEPAAPAPWLDPQPSRPARPVASRPAPQPSRPVRPATSPAAPPSSPTKPVRLDKKGVPYPPSKKQAATASKRPTAMATLGINIGHRDKM
ncbi:MAG: DEAD/DEAH box helicase, partial [Candidatus Xenobia bacterium]